MAKVIDEMVLQVNVKTDIKEVVNAIASAIEQIKSAQLVNEVMQKNCQTGSQTWHQHETVADRLRTALAKLGE